VGVVIVAWDRPAPVSDEAALLCLHAEIAAKWRDACAKAGGYLAAARDAAACGGDPVTAQRSAALCLRLAHREAEKMRAVARAAAALREQSQRDRGRR